MTLQNGYGSCCSLRLGASGSEPASAEQQHRLRTPKCYVIPNAASRNPALNVPLGTRAVKDYCQWSAI